MSVFEKYGAFKKWAAWLLCNSAAKSKNGDTQESQSRKIVPPSHRIIVRLHYKTT